MIDFSDNGRLPKRVVDQLTTRGAIRAAQSLALWLLENDGKLSARHMRTAEQSLGRLLHKAYSHRHGCENVYWREPRESGMYLRGFGVIGQLSDADADSMTDTQPRL